jgi:hypothetical protein
LFAYYNIMSHGRIPWNASDPSVPPAWNDWGTIPWFVMVAIAVWAMMSQRLQSKTANGIFSRSTHDGEVALANPAGST